MTDLKIDNEYMESLSDEFEKMLNALSNQLEILRDEDADVFERYMAFNRLTVAYRAVENAMGLSKALLKAGHALNHEFFNTKAFKKNGWDRINIERNPFFEIEDKEEAKEEEYDLKKAEQIDCRNIDQLIIRLEKTIEDFRGK